MFCRDIHRSLESLNPGQPRHIYHPFGLCSLHMIETCCPGNFQTPPLKSNYYFHLHLHNSFLYLPTLMPAGWKLRSHTSSRLRANFSCLIEKCELLPSCLTQFQKYVNSDPCKERKPCVKWINGNTFLAISDFWSEKHWERACLWQTSDVFGRLRTSSGIFRKTLLSGGGFLDLLGTVLVCIVLQYHLYKQPPALWK